MADLLFGFVDTNFYVAVLALKKGLSSVANKHINI
jgi:hypothetical protein